MTSLIAVRPRLVMNVKVILSSEVRPLGIISENYHPVQSVHNIVWEIVNRGSLDNIFINRMLTN